MAEKNRASSMAIVEEVTAGTPVDPSSGTEFIALQEGFSISPKVDVQSNNELRNNIGLSKNILGVERPDGAFSHYFRHCGVEGQTPGYDLLLESCIGPVDANATERTTAAASTVSLLKLAAGGTDFAKGKAVLVKDSTYSVRPVDSVATNDLTLGFELPTAPAAGISTGKCVNYSPSSDGTDLKTFTGWLYRGGGGALEVIAGARVTQMSISVAAGNLINSSYSFAGTKYYFDPIRISATDIYLDFTSDNGTFAAVVTAQLYNSPHELASALSSAMESADPLETYTVVYRDADGKFKITSSSTVLSLLWNTGANTANTIGDKIGFSTAADDTGAGGTVGYTSDNAQSWAPSLTPSYDSADPLVAKNNEVLIGDSNDTSCFCASSIDITVTNDVQDVECICATSGIQDKIVSQRSVEISVVGILERHDADKFNKFINNSDVKFMLNLGNKTGGNWVPGTVASIYVPQATISAHEAGDNNGLVTMNITIKPYVAVDGSGEFFINFL